MPKKYHTIFLGLVLGGTYLLYLPALGFEFVFDDQFQIAQNPHLSSWSYLSVYFTQNVWSHVAGAVANLYRPLFLVWLRLNFILFGNDPTGWHLTTILLHLAVTGLVYVLARRLLRDAWPALMAALLFAIHPVHVEAVAWISGLTEPLSTALLLGAFLCYLTPLENNGSRKMLWRSGSLVLFALAVLAKETAVTLPLLVLLYELTLRPESVNNQGTRTKVEIGRLLWNIAPFVIVACGYLGVRAVVLGGLVHRSGDSAMLDSLLRWPWLLCTYCRLLLWPSHLSPLYDPVVIHPWVDVRIWFPLALLPAGASALWLGRKLPGARMAFFLTGWFVITLGPALAISCVAFPWELYQDRYLYLPSVALVIAAAAALRFLLSSAHTTVKTVTLAVAVVVVAALAMASRSYIQYWKDNYSLFSRANAVAPRNELAKEDLVHELVRRGEYAKALKAAEEDVLFHPESARANQSAGGAAFSSKDYALAERYWSAAAQIDTSQVRSWQYLGLSRIELGNYAGAETALAEAILLDPKNPNLRYSRGLALSKLSQWSAAREEFLQELKLDAGNPSALAAFHEAEAHLKGK